MVLLEHHGSDELAEKNEDELGHLITSANDLQEG